MKKIIFAIAGLGIMLPLLLAVVLTANAWQALRGD